MTDFDMNGILAQAQAMQQQLLEAQAEAASQEIEVQVGGGMVKIVVTGGLEFRSISIDPKVVDPSDVEMLEDLVLAAIHDAIEQAQALSQAALGGLDLSSLGPLGLGGS